MNKLFKKSNLKIIILCSIIFKFFLFFLFLNLNENLFKYEYDYQEVIDNFFINNIGLNLSFGNERLPIYQIFIFFVFFIFKSKNIIIFVQIILSCINLIIIYKIGLLFNKRIAIFILILATVNPMYNLFSILILADYLFLMFSLFFVYKFTKFLIYSKLNDAIISFIFLGLMSLTKPVIIYFPFFLVIYLLIFIKKNRFKIILIFLLIFYSINSAWQIRNLATYNNYFLITQNQTNIVNWYLPIIEQEHKKIRNENAKKNIQDEWEEFQKKNPKSDNSSYEVYTDNLSKKFFFHKIKYYDLFTIFKTWTFGSVKSILLPSFLEYKYYLDLKPNLSFSKIEGNNFTQKLINYTLKFEINLFYFLFAICIFFTLLLKYLSLKGAISFYKNNKKIFFFYAMYVFYFLLVTGPIGTARYRLPFEIIFIIFLGFYIKNLNIIKK